MPLWEGILQHKTCAYLGSCSVTPTTHNNESHQTSYTSAAKYTELLLIVSGGMLCTMKQSSPEDPRRVSSDSTCQDLCGFSMLLFCLVLSRTTGSMWSSPSPPRRKNAHSSVVFPVCYSWFVAVIVPDTDISLLTAVRNAPAER